MILGTQLEESRVKETLEGDKATVRSNERLVNPIIKDMRNGRCAFCEKPLKDLEKTYDWAVFFASVNKSYKNLKVQVVVVNECCSRECHSNHSAEIREAIKENSIKNKMPIPQIISNYKMPIPQIISN